MNADIHPVRFMRWLAALAAASFALATAHGQQGTPPPPPDQTRPAGSPAHTDKEGQQYRDLAVQLGQEIDKLVRKGLRDAADELQRRLDERGGRPEAPPPGGRGPSGDRVRHLLEAAEHLSQAGMEEQAMRLRREAESLAQKGLGPCAECEALHKRLDQLEKAVQKLQDENRDLRRLLQQKPL